MGLRWRLVLTPFILVTTPLGAYKTAPVPAAEVEQRRQVQQQVEAAQKETEPILQKIEAGTASATDIATLKRDFVTVQAELAKTRLKLEQAEKKAKPLPPLAPVSGENEKKLAADLEEKEKQIATLTAKAESLEQKLANAQQGETAPNTGSTEEATIEKLSKVQKNLTDALEKLTNETNS